MTQQSRRNFLKTTAIAGASVALGDSALTAPKATKKNATVTLVVLK